MNKVVNYIRSAYDELVYKVTWPNWEQLQKYTVLVLVGIVIFTVLIYVMDMISNTVFKTFYNLF